jgi:GT2 family glycosyltransferase
MKTIGIVILNYKNWQDTLRCLDSVLFVNNSRNIQIYIIDNQSENESVDRISEYLIGIGELFVVYPSTERLPNKNKINIITSNNNGGFAAGNNIGITQALLNENEYIFILNNDTLLYNNTTEFLMSAINDNVVLTTPLVENKDGNISKGSARKRPLKYDILFRKGLFSFLFPNNYLIKNHYYNISKIIAYNKPVPIDIVSGSAMFFDRKYFLNAGLLDEATFLYLEEFIIHENIRRHNYKTLLVPYAKITHIGGQSTNSINRSRIQNIVIDSAKVYFKKYRSVNSLGWFIISNYLKFSYFIYNRIK